MNISKLLVLSAAAAALSGMAGTSMAGTISGVKAEPASAIVGAQVKVTVTGDDAGLCGLRVEYGNGDFDLTKMNAGRDNFPRSFNKTYNKAGTYTIIAKGGRDGSALGCPGEAKTTVTIAEAPKPAAAAAPAAGAKPATAAAPACPEGYNLNAKTVDKKSGAFTCAATKDAKKPEKAMECPAGTDYFATPKGSSLGCKKPAQAKK